MLERYAFGNPYNSMKRKPMSDIGHRDDRDNQSVVSALPASTLDRAGTKNSARYKILFAHDYIKEMLFLRSKVVGSLYQNLSED